MRVCVYVRVRVRVRVCVSLARTQEKYAFLKEFCFWSFDKVN